MKYFLYARKSTDVEDKQILSIDAQLAELRTLAKQEQLNVVEVFVLFSILGGVVFFGPLGFILGPLVLSVFLSVVHVFNLTERGA